MVAAPVLVRPAALLVLLALRCSSAPWRSEPPCYGVRPADAFACRSDWTGIDAVSTGTEGSTTRAEACACPPDTSCHAFSVSGAPVVACALNAH